MTVDQELKIRWAWEPAESVRVPEHRDTWARIEIKAGTDFVTLVEDRDSGSSRRSIYSPLYPLAEWVAYNWWFLQADTRPSRFLAQDSVLHSLAPQSLPTALWEHHSIRASGDGFVWPDLLIVPDDSETRLLWGGSSSHSNWPIKFLTRGDLRVRSEHLQKELGLLVTETLTRLSEQGVTGTVLEKEWAAIQQTDPDEVEYCLAAARLGLDPYSDAEPYEQDILQAADTLTGRLLTDFLDAVNPDHITSGLAWISSQASAIEIQQKARSSHDLADVATPDADVIRRLRASARRLNVRSSARPWDVGYEQARFVRGHMVADSKARFPVNHFIRSLIRKAPDISLQALGAGAGHPEPLVIVGQNRTASSTRFTLSRALWHYIWDDSPLFVVTTAHTHRQRVERAFTAELLAPAEGIAQMLESPPELASQEEVEQVAQRYGVSSMVVEHQLRNHLIASAA